MVNFRRTPRSAIKDHPEVLVWVAWTLLSAYLLAHHEMWIDELQSWGIVRDSHSLFQLIHNLKWEGHPPLWYLVLWPVSWISTAQSSMQVLNLVVCSTTTFLVLRNMPAPLVVRAVLVFGYVPFYEVGVVSRSYGLMFLMGISAMILAERTEGPNSPAAAAIIGMALTTVVAVPLAVAFVLARWGLPWWRMRDRNRHYGKWVGVGMGAVVLAVAMSMPANGGGPRAAFSLPTTTSVNHALSALTNVVVPIPKFQISFWNTSMLQKIDPRLPWIVGLTLFILVLVAIRRSAAAVIIWMIGVGGYMTAVAISGMPYRVRHASVIWLALILIVWMIAGDRRLTTDEKRRFAPTWVQVSAMLTAGACLFGAFFAARQDVRYRFSGAEDAAQWIKEDAVGPYAILCAVDPTVCASVALRFRTDAYPTALGEPFTFVQFRRGWKWSTTSPFLAVNEARALQQRIGKKVFIVADAWIMPPDCRPGILTIPVIVEPIGVCEP